MRRWLTILLAALVSLAAVLFSAANLERVALDFYFFQLALPAGVMVLAALLGGALLAGTVLYLGVILPLRMRLAGLRRQAEQPPAAAPGR